MKPQKWQNKTVLYLNATHHLNNGPFGYRTALDHSDTVDICLSDTSGNQIAKSSPIAEWSINWMVTWIADKKSGN